MNATPENYEFNGFRLDPNDGILHRPDGEMVVLTPKLLQLLILFIESDGRVLTRDELMNTLWPDSAVEPASLKQLVYSLRRAMGETDGSEEIIKTLPRRGYRFVALGETPRRAEYSVTTVTIEEEEIEIDGPQPPSNVERALLPGEQNGRRKTARAVLIPFGVLVLGVVGLGVVGYVFWVRSPPPVLTTENISLKRLTHTNDLYWAIISPNGQFVAYVAVHKDGTQSMELLDVTTRSERTLVPAASVSFYGGSFTRDSSQLYYDTWDHGDRSGVSTLYQISVLGDKPRKILDNVPGPISFSPDGKRFAFSRHEISPKTSLVTANSADGSDQQVIATSEIDDDFIAPNWAPDGHSVLFVHSLKTDEGTKWAIGEISLDGERHTVAGPLKQRFWGAIWLGDGSNILLSASAPDSKVGQLFTVSYRTGEIKRLTNDLNYYSGLSATADGQKIIVAQGERTNDLWVTPVGNIKPVKIAGGAFVIDSLTWAPDDRILYNMSETGQHHLTSVAPDGSGATRVLPPGTQGLFPNVSPSGDLLTFVSNRSGSWQVWTSKPDGSDMRQLTNEPDSVSSPQFALDGNSIIYMRWIDDRPVLTMMDRNGQGRRDVSPAYVADWVVSHDTKKIAYSYYDLDTKKTRTAVRQIGGEQPTAVLDLMPRDLLLFSPGDDALLTKRMEPDADPMSTIWSFPIKGGPPSIFYKNPPDNIYAASFSADKDRFAVVQGRTIANLVLLSPAK